MGALVSVVQNGIESVVPMAVPAAETELWSIPHADDPAEYAKWVMTPVATQSTFRLASSGLIEPFTKNYWWMVPTLWLPLAARALAHTSGDAAAAVGVLAGFAAWFPFEYAAHRFVFHCMRWPRVQFAMHGLHHRFPLDAERLVFPALPAMAAATVVWQAVGALTDSETAAALMAGFMAGYVVYDLTHYALHHAKWNGPLAQHHRIHHYIRPDMNFGITTRCFDRLLGTLVEPPADGQKLRTWWMLQQDQHDGHAVRPVVDDLADRPADAVDGRPPEDQAAPGPEGGGGAAGGADDWPGGAPVV